MFISVKILWLTHLHVSTFTTQQFNTFQLFQLFHSYLESVIHLHLQKKKLLALIIKCFSVLQISYYSTVAIRGHRFNKEKTLQIKEFFANIKNTSKKSTPAHCKQKNCTLQAKVPHTANKTPARCKQERNCKKDLHTASKRITHCKQNHRTLQTKLLHTANKTPARCK